MKPLGVRTDVFVAEKNLKNSDIIVKHLTENMFPLVQKCGGACGNENGRLTYEFHKKNTVPSPPMMQNSTSNDLNCLSSDRRSKSLTRIHREARQWFQTDTHERLEP